ncbi:protein JINGUBANG-like [Sesbania bispinosa]|nr:protein JINGUBANG-like [Sesbania bispinosa]
MANEPTISLHRLSSQPPTTTHFIVTLPQLSAPLRLSDVVRTPLMSSPFHVHDGTVARDLFHQWHTLKRR